MYKLYFKKLLYTILFFASYFLLAGCFAFIWYLIFNDLFSFSEQFTTILIAILAIPVILNVVYRNRCNSAPHKRDYWKMTESEYFTFGKDFVKTLMSRENIVHTLAFMTLDFLFSIPIGISASTTVWIFITGMILLLATQGTIFTLVNTLLWCLVHRRWQNIKKYATYSSKKLD